jgi:hypothetical protein
VGGDLGERKFICRGKDNGRMQYSKDNSSIRFILERVNLEI